MAKIKHTPGPWEIEFSRTGVEWPIIIAPGEPHYDDGSAYIVCEIDESYPIGKKTSQRELALANARLIASVPTLQSRINRLEALLKHKQGLIDRLSTEKDKATEQSIAQSEINAENEGLEAEKAELAEILTECISWMRATDYLARSLNPNFGGRDLKQSEATIKVVNKAEAALAKAKRET